MKHRSSAGFRSGGDGQSGDGIVSGAYVNSPALLSAAGPANREEPGLDLTATSAHYRPARIDAEMVSPNG